ncbi:MAG: type II toxin-antitoxin system RelE/ParE family toxin [Hassallia sp. WJT32-NPBG1]|jgi:toxin ParE1/3/4|nr:type II toxin-antitoxin system RelE/ParE family toxin [Hassallia sp. WJT32-NPBG1]
MSIYIISPSASRDLNQIADYFLTRNLEVGEKLFREFNKKCQNIANFPNIGRSYAHIRPGLRGLPLDGYVILYKVVDHEVEILRVVSGRQDLESLFNAMCDLFLKPLSKPLPHRERGFDSCSPSLVGKGLGVRFARKLHTALFRDGG